MRCCVFTCCLAGLLLTGCNDNSRPRAGRSRPDRAANGATPLPIHSIPGVEAGGPGSADQVLDDVGGELRLNAVTLTVPKGWGRKQARSSFIQAEFMLRRAEGDDADGRLTVSEAGGSIEANIERWQGQFGGATDNSHQEVIDVNGIKVTLVDLSGDYLDQPGPFAPAVKRSGYRMVAGIIPVNGQLHFVKAVGPHKTIQAHAEAIRAFIRSVKQHK